MKRLTLLAVLFFFIISCTYRISVKDYNRYAFELVNKKLYKEALFYLLKVEKKENSYKIENNIAICYEALGKKELAKKYYLKALKLKNAKVVRKNYEQFKKSAY